MEPDPGQRRTEPDGSRRDGGDGLERHPPPGSSASDVDVQAERQEEGVEAEIEEEAVEAHRRRLAEREVALPGEAVPPD